jgi:ankyrin repeat protein
MALRAALQQAGFSHANHLPAIFKGFTALHLAADRNNASVVPLLIGEAGVDVQAVNAFGDTALHVACMQGSWETASALISADPAGCCLRTLNASRLSPMGVCTLSNRPSGIDLLLNAGAQMITEADSELLGEYWVNSCDVLIAASKGYRQCAERLLARVPVSQQLHEEAMRLLQEHEEQA